MIEKALTSADVEFVTTLHGEEQVSFLVLLQPRGDQADRLLRAMDDVALGELDEAARENETPEGDEAARPRPSGRWTSPSRRCAPPAAEAVGPAGRGPPAGRAEGRSWRRPGPTR